LKKNQIGAGPSDLIEVIDRLKVFFDPILGMKEMINQRWIPNRGWGQ